MTATGADTIWAYVYEDDDAYNQAPGDATDSTFKTFGANVTADAIDRSNNSERIFQPFSRTSETVLEGAFDGSLGAGWTLANTWWLQFIFGQPTVSGNQDPFTHTYEIDNGNPPRTAQVVEETHYKDGTVEQTVYSGVFAESADMDVSVEDTVSVSLSGSYATEQFFSDASSSPFGEIGTQPVREYRPVHFGNSLLKMDVTGSGSVDADALVQDASVSFAANAQGERELGSRILATPSFLQFEPDLSYTKLSDATNTSDEQQVAAYGSTSATTVPDTLSDGNDLEGELLFDAQADLTNKVTVEMDGAFPDSYSRNNVGDPSTTIEQNIDRIVNDVSIVVESNEETPP
jgi:hypothetical protein